MMSPRSSVEKALSLKYNPKKIFSIDFSIPFQKKDKLYIVNLQISLHCLLYMFVFMVYVVYNDLVVLKSSASTGK